MRRRCRRVDRSESSQGTFARYECKHEECKYPEHCHYRHDNLRWTASVDRHWHDGSGVAQGNVQHEALPGIEWACAVLILELARRLPGGIEIQIQREARDRAGTIGKCEIVVDLILRVVFEQNSRKLVART